MTLFSTINTMSRQASLSKTLALCGADSQRNTERAVAPSFNTTSIDIGPNNLGKFIVTSIHGVLQRIELHIKLYGARHLGSVKFIAHVSYSDIPEVPSIVLRAEFQCENEVLELFREPNISYSVYNEITACLRKLLFKVNARLSLKDHYGIFDALHASKNKVKEALGKNSDYISVNLTGLSSLTYTASSTEQNRLVEKNASTVSAADTCANTGADEKFRQFCWYHIPTGILRKVGVEKRADTGAQLIRKEPDFLHFDIRDNNGVYAEASIPRAYWPDIDTALEPLFRPDFSTFTKGVGEDLPYPEGIDE